ncbi:MAG: T9SS type A sorting domain-containing protein [Bacteroidales bacterium]|nr:T9SS type A sorting domain-containing protein [Bacteroidales bacterium]
MIVYSLQGKQIKSYNIEKQKEVKLDVSGFEKGMYLLVFKNKQHYMYSIKIIKN